MRSLHTMTATYPLAGSEDGLPVVITFWFEPPRPTRVGLGPGWPAVVEFQSASPSDHNMPSVICAAITAWASEWIDDDDGYHRAWDAALDDIERQRESARDMGMKA